MRKWCEKRGQRYYGFTAQRDIGLDQGERLFPGQAGRAISGIGDFKRGLSESGVPRRGGRIYPYRTGLPAASEASGVGEADRPGAGDAVSGCVIP